MSHRQHREERRGERAEEKRGEKRGGGEEGTSGGNPGLKVVFGGVLWLFLKVRRKSLRRPNESQSPTPQLCGVVDG